MRNGKRGAGVVAQRVYFRWRPDIQSMTVQVDAQFVKRFRIFSHFVMSRSSMACRACRIWRRRQQFTRMAEWWSGWYLIAHVLSGWWGSPTHAVHTSDALSITVS